MSSIYIVITLIGTLCVLSAVICILLTIKIHLDCERRGKSKAKRQQEYDEEIRHCRCIRKILIVLLMVCIVAEVIFLSLALTGPLDPDVTEDNLAEKAKIVQNDPKDRLAQNKEEKIKTLFIDYLFFSWYGGEKEKYVENVRGLFDGKELVADAQEENLEGEDKDIYAAYVKRQNEIDLKRVPDGATLEQVWKGEVMAEKLTVDEYQEEYELWSRRCELCPTAACQQQMGRTAVDVQTTMMAYPEYEDEWDVIIEYAMRGIQAYLALMFYISADESKADCCYWIAKVFYDLAEKLSAMSAEIDESADYAEHCYLMAYAFAEVGLGYESVDQRTDDHIDQMIKIRDKAETVLEK